MRKWLFIFLTLIPLSCRMGNTIIPRRDLVPLLVEMHIADAMALSTHINDYFGGLDSAMLYSAILEKYGYTKEELEYTLKYYSEDPEKLNEIYDEVFSKISKESEDVNELYNSTTTSRTLLIWKPNKTRYNIHSDTASYPPVFDCPIDTTGTFILSVEVKISPRDESVNPSIVAYFYNPLNDREEKRIYFKKIPLRKSNYIREYTLFKECTDTSISRLRIIIPMHDTPDSVFRKDIDMQDLRVSLYKSDKLKK